jgi:group I intron endonuclease
MLNTIYILRNRANSKVYVGQTWQSLTERFDNAHGYDNCLYLSRAIKKYGKDNFYYEVMTFCSTQETADYWESCFIAKLDACNRDKGYNLRSGGSRGLQSEETKKRMSDAQKGRIVSEDTKKKLSEILRNNPIKMIGEDNPMFGKTKEQHPMFNQHHTDEAKQKMSAAKLGKPSSKKGKPMSEESRRKMSEAKKAWYLEQAKK